MSKIKILLLGFLFLLSSRIVFAVDINSCSELNETNIEYYLTENITSSAASCCINITANNVILDCQNNLIDDQAVLDTYGIYIYRNISTTTNITIKNCIATNWDYGIYFENVKNNTLENLTLNNNVNSLYFENSSFNVVKNAIISLSEYASIFLSNSDNNTLMNMTITSNDEGVYFYNSNSNNLTNSNSESNYGSGISLEDSSLNIISNSKSQNNDEFGIYIYSSSGSDLNLIYNNLFNNTDNFFIEGTIYQNHWNTTRQNGSRVYSNGIEIGGNYWTNSTSNGFSDTCEDSDHDGFCDDYFNLTEDDNIDYLPLSNEYYTTQISGCLELDHSDMYNLFSDIINSDASTCINILANNIVLDCQGYRIDGINAENSIGIMTYRDTITTTNITLKNCIISDWGYYGLLFYKSSGNQITNLSIINSTQYGSWFGLSSNNLINNSMITGAENNAIYFDGGQYNNILNSTFYDNEGDGIVFYNCNNSVVANSTFKNNYVAMQLLYNSNTTIYNNIIQDSNEEQEAIFLQDSILNLIYNNLFNNTLNIGIYGATNADWNTTRQNGSRVYSNGIEIGGNYWTNSTSNGFSDTCEDSDHDGFCDDYFNLTEDDNIDYLPLSYLHSNGEVCSHNSNCFSGYCVHSICRASSTYCGDIYCDTGETNPNCPSDCPPTLVAPSGGGLFLEGKCTYNWYCTEWFECINDSQTRTCTNLGTCKDSKGKPTESQSCVSLPTPTNTTLPLPTPMSTPVLLITPTPTAGTTPLGLGAVELMASVVVSIILIFVIIKNRKSKKRILGGTNE